MGCSRFLITNATSREWFFFSVPQMLSLNTTYDCCAHFLCREILLFITHCTKAFSNQKTRGGISLPCCLQRTFLLTHYHLKQTICLLSISPCRFLHLHFPCLLPSLSTPSCCIVIVASPAQAHQGPKHPHAASPPPPPQTDICARLLSLPGTPMSKMVILCLLVLVPKASENCSRVTEFCKKQYSQFSIADSRPLNLSAVTPILCPGLAF